MQKLKFALFGTGFWANYQLPGWYELEGVDCIAAYNRTRSRADTFAKKFDIPRTYDNPVNLLDTEELDFVDICTDVSTHYSLTKLAAERGLDVVCQKPMAPSLEESRSLLEICQHNGVKLFINENFRFQSPIRRVKEILDSGVIGTAFKARITFCSAFPVFDNQPFLADLDQFILTDIGSHILDVSRYLCGEAKNIYTLIHTVNPKIKGEDVANCLMEMENGMHCYAEMSYASVLEKEAFPETLVLIEGSKGSIKLSHDYQVSVTTRDDTVTETVAPKNYPWVDPEYLLVHSSIVDAQRDILNGLRGNKAETTGEDNFKTIRLVYAAYKSAKTGKVVCLDEFK